ncbi:hypothetical protein F5Y06DRAFT_271798 [Hypoxylon sp. FL0890]|nr:hypothetical protein F5Y06DRAFT_271798 [Hypoxylon sp. FL0890]
MSLQNQVTSKARPVTMEQQQNAAIDQPIDHQPPQLAVILQNIDELMNEAILQRNAANSDEISIRSQQSPVERFKEMMVAIQRKTSKATFEVEMKLGPNLQLRHGFTTDAPLEDLVGVSPASEFNRVLGRMNLGGKQSYKLRNLPTSAPIPQLVIDDGTVASLPLSPEDSIVVLQPTLRNVWVIQHAYAKLMNHKEHLIKQYLEVADISTGLTRKFSREYYEELSLANLPSKNKLGNLLDVKRSSNTNASHDMMIVLVFTDADGSPRYVEAVSGNSVDIGTNDENNPYLVLPVAEASIKKLYDTYRSLRKATSEERRAIKDKIFAASQPVDTMDELQKQFNFGSSGDPSQMGSSKKRRRMLEDDE